MKPSRLYRYFNAEDELLYIGISLCAFTRLRQHIGIDEWAGQITKVTIEHFANRSAALQAERKAIREEKPKYNIYHKNSKPTKEEQQEEELTKFEQAKDNIINYVVKLKPLYRVNTLHDELKISRFLIRKAINADELQTVQIKAKKNYTEYVTGWQIIDWIEHLEYQELKP